MNEFLYLHDCSVDDDEVLRRRLDGASLPRVARVEEERGALQAHPVTLPPALPGQLDLKMRMSGSVIVRLNHLQVVKGNCQL